MATYASTRSSRKRAFSECSFCAPEGRNKRFKTAQRRSASAVRCLRIHVSPQRRCFVNVSSDMLMCFKGPFYLYYNAETKVLELFDSACEKELRRRNYKHCRRIVSEQVRTLSSGGGSTSVHFIDLRDERMDMRVERVEISGRARVTMLSNAVSRTGVQTSSHFSLRIDKASLFVFSPDQKPWSFGDVHVEAYGAACSQTQVDFGRRGEVYIDRLVVNSKLADRNNSIGTSTRGSIASTVPTKHPFSIVCGGGGRRRWRIMASFQSDHPHLYQHLEMLRKNLREQNMSPQDYSVAIDYLCEDLNLSEYQARALKDIPVSCARAQAQEEEEERAMDPITQLIMQRSAQERVRTVRSPIDITPGMFVLSGNDDGNLSHRYMPSPPPRPHRPSLNTIQHRLRGPHPMMMAMVSPMPPSVTYHPPPARGWSVQRTAQDALPVSEQDDKALDVSDATCIICYSRPPRVVCPNGCLSMCAECHNKNKEHGNTKCPTCNAEGVFTKINNV